MHLSFLEIKKFPQNHSFKIAEIETEIWLCKKCNDFSLIDLNEKNRASSQQDQVINNHWVRGDWKLGYLIQNIKKLTIS